MPRYIDADNIHPVLVTIYNAATSRIARKTIEKCDYELSMIPTSNVAPVVHARWEKIQRTKRYVDGIGVDVETGKPFINKKEYKYDEYKCPVCKKFAKGDYLRFCDYCGAKFDEMFGKNEEERDDA